jgi:hypothetical protein
MTFGKWWELLSKYKYGITYDLANKIVRYLKKYQDKLPTSINIPQQEEILSWAYYNEYGQPAETCGTIPYAGEFSDNGGFYNGF